MEISRESRNNFEQNKTENITNQNLCESGKAMRRVKFMALKVHMRKEMSQINNLSFFLAKCRKEQI